MPFTFWVDGHAVVSRWYSFDVFRRIQSSSFFSEPVVLMFCGIWWGGQDSDFLRLGISAVATSRAQATGWSHLVMPDLPSTHGAGGLIGLDLGHRWFEVPQSVRTLLRLANPGVGPGFLRFFEDTCRWVLLGSEDIVAARFLDSIPGIRGERRESLEDAIQGVLGEMVQLIHKYRTATGGSAAGHGMRGAFAKRMEAAKEELIQVLDKRYAIRVLQPRVSKNHPGECYRAWLNRLRASEG
jgi:hypothetical protein